MPRITRILKLETWKPDTGGQKKVKFQRDKSGVDAGGEAKGEGVEVHKHSAKTRKSCIPFSDYQLRLAGSHQTCSPTYCHLSTVAPMPAFLTTQDFFFFFN